MNERVRQLIPAIVSYVNQHGSYVSKTKLLKLLYLFDIEWYRDHGETYTGFDWVFLHLGPWTNEYDSLLDDLTSTVELNVRRSSNPSFDTEFYSTPRPVEFSSIFDSYASEIPFRIALGNWAEKSTAQILDYVYFWTEPMKDAVRYDQLDFSSVSKDRPQAYRRSRSGVTPQEAEAARQRILAMRQSTSSERAKEEPLPSPNYDEEYFDAIARLEAME